MRAIDAHLHVWDLTRSGYQWLDEERWDGIRRSYGLHDVRSDLKRAGIGRVVLVQAENSDADTSHMLGVAHGEPLVAGIVGWVPLIDPQIEGLLDSLASESPLVGVRHILTAEADPDWILQPAVLESLEVLSLRGLVFEMTSDLLRHLELASVVAERVPELKISINHIGKPPIGTRGWEPWASLLARVASYPNTYSKLSGLTTPSRPDWSGQDFRPYVEFAIETFGTDRLMFGGNWPVTLVAGSYLKMWEEMQRALPELSEGEREAIFRSNAERIFSLREADGAGGGGSHGT